MSFCYPKGPESFPKSLIRPSLSYRVQAWLAMLALLSFLTLYGLTSGWLAWKAFTLWRAALGGGKNPILLVLSGVAAAFLAVFMVKALFFLKRSGTPDDLEITEGDEPELFAFLHRLALEARAPKPRRVFLSPRVNAGVFFDVSPLNLVFPSRKNLEIGLPLVNVLTLPELKAVLAHEFGHFAQRSMAVGRWVYTARRIAEHIVAKRDGFDRLLDQMAYFTVAIQYTWVIPVVGWVLKVIVWALRSVVDFVFRLVVLAERALSREMEFQADRIAVSLTGSDALVHALYRMTAAETAWERTLEFANEEIAKGRAVPDLFDLQTRILRRLREVMNDPDFGIPPQAGSGEGRRIFQPEKVQVSKMWATHPFSHEREENAKRIPLAGELNDTPAWVLFRDPDSLKLRMCAEMIRDIKIPFEVVSREHAMERLEAEYDRGSYTPLYRGSYLDRFVTRHAAKLPDQYSPADIRQPDELYTESLSRDLESLASLKRERGLLEAVRDGVARNSEGKLQHRGRPVRSKQDAAVALDDLAAQIQLAETRLAAHDRRCRSTFHALAVAQGRGWEESWLGSLKLLHYAEHTLANILDAQGALRNTIAMATARRKVNDKEFQRVFAAAGDLYHPLAEVPQFAGKVLPDDATLALLGFPDWPDVIGEWKLSPPYSDDLSDWLNVIDGWTQQVVNAVSRLRRASLDRLLAIESRLEEARVRGTLLEPAPPASQVSFEYRTFVTGRERPLQRELDPWSKFHAADGWIPGLARLAVSGGILAGLVGMSSVMGTARLTVYNGLGREVVAQVDGQGEAIAPGGHRVFTIPAGEPVRLSAKTRQGTLIESFSETADIFDGDYVYNIAGASPLVEWTAVYGPARPKPDRPLGAPRWMHSSADAILTPPPSRIETSQGQGGTRTVLAAATGTSVQAQLSMTEDATIREMLIRLHVRWDDGASPHLSEWLALALALPDCEALFTRRLEEYPLELQTLRMEQELVSPEARARACERHRKLLAANPGNPDLEYLVARAVPDEDGKDAAFKAGFARHPGHGWFAYAAGSTYAQECQWPQARKAYEVALRVPALRNPVGLELGRLQRIGQGVQASLQDLVPRSELLRACQMMETGGGTEGGPVGKAYGELNKGRLKQALGTLKGAGGTPPPRMIRLLAASDGATPEMVRMATKLPFPEGLDEDTFWCAVGVALREGQPLDEYLKHLGRFTYAEDTEEMTAFIEALRTTRDPRRAEPLLRGTQLVFRARAYSTAMIALGEKVPGEWREFAKRALFTGERPYFN